MTDVGRLGLDDAAILRAELAEVAARRTLHGVASDALAPEGDPGARDLHGLAFSGGGVRAAAVSLGVAQALAREGRLARVDYLSTVSGGGYLGGALSSLLGSGAPDPATTGPDFPLQLGDGGPEPPALSHLRAHADFLAPEGTPGRLRLAAVLVRGVLLNVVLFLPWILGAVVCTEIAYELESHFGITHFAGWTTLVLLGAAGLLVVTFPFVVRFARHRFTWARRNRYDMLFAAALGASVVALAVLPFTLLTRSMVLASWHAVRSGIDHRLAMLDRPWVWAGLIVLGILWASLHGRFAIIGRVTRLAGRGGLWLLGPTLLVGAYLLFCVRFVHLPFVSVHYAGRAAFATADSVRAGHLPHTLRRAIDLQLREEGGKLSHQASVETDSLAGTTWVRDSSWYPRRGADWLFGESNGPGGHPGVARFPLRLVRGDPAELDVVVTLRAYPEPRDLLLLGLFGVLVLINGRIVDVNVTSLHQFYRDRLSRAFLLRPRTAGVADNDAQSLSGLNPSRVAPYHLLNATVNVSASANPAVRGRNADFFLFSRHACGSRSTGYCATVDLERADARLDLASAMAVSGAAAGPRMGVHTDGSIAGDMALFNLRLGYWLPNPAWVTQGGHPFRLRGPGPSYLLRETFGVLHERGRYVNVSDGGHIENLGVYELLRRRCRLIVAVDAEADEELTCGALSTLMRYARIDLGITIAIDLAPLRRDASGWSTRHVAVGTIHYGPGPNETGTLVYLKASRTGDENAYIAAFAREHPSFPHQSTADQFFTEEEFEVYRALGDHIATTAIHEEGPARDALAALHLRPAT